MGNIIQSYCCNDSPDRAVDEREEQSRIWSDLESNQQYGACFPPRSPTVYKIVLPKLIPVEIDDVHIQTNNQQSTLLLENSNDDSIASSNQTTPIKSSSATTPNTTAHDQDEGRGTPTTNVVSDCELSEIASNVEPNIETENGGDCDNNKKKSKSKNKKKKQKFDPSRPAVIKEEYCAEQFDYLRSLILKDSEHGQQQFKTLLWSCIPWSAPGGKSGSVFLKTVNDQFILKEMSKFELQSFLSVADEYFKYVENSYHDNKPSLLSTIFGIYRIVYTNNTTQSSSEYHFMVMRNLFYKRNITQRFDLKGSVRNRLVDTDDPDQTEHVLMDENLLRIACDHPLFIHARSKQILNECIDSDSRFLCSISVMDYSLLVGVDKENKELVLGIIDYVRPFTWDKKIERVVKSVVSMELPTIVEPELYRERFCEAMDKYFESVPDDVDWSVAC